MSEFTKVYRKWHAENNGKYVSAIHYHKALQSRFGNWKSPSSFRKLQYELNNSEMMLGLKKVAVKNLLSEKRQLRQEIEKLKADKQIVVVPRIVASYIETEEDNDCNRVGTLVYGHYKAIDGYEEHSELHEWIADNFDIFLEAIVNGYTVKKEKRYILKHIDLSEQDDCVSLYLSHGLYKEFQHERYSKDVDMSEIKRCHFTQSEIDKLNIGSYEQIEVDE